MASKLLEAEGVEAAELYVAARLFAVCAASVQAKPNETSRNDFATWTEAAIESLKRAIAAGFDDFDRMREHDDFEIIRDRPEFQSLLPKSD